MSYNYDMASLFAEIIEGKRPGQFVYADEYCVALLDKFPSLPGQTLIVPRREVDYFTKLTNNELSHLMLVAKKLTTALDRAYKTERTCLVIEGFEVPHVHLKLYPMPNNDTPLGKLMHQGKLAEDNVLGNEAEKIKAVLAELA